MKDEGKMSTAGIVFLVIGIVVALIIVGTVVLAGFTFLWASSFESESGADTMNVRVTIDAATDIVEVEILSGDVRWSEYDVNVDGTIFMTDSVLSFAGSTALFTSPGWDAVAGQTYSVSIVETGGKVVWSEDVSAV